jgi:hypothetical protein
MINGLSDTYVYVRQVTGVLDSSLSLLDFIQGLVPECRDFGLDVASTDCSGMTANGPIVPRKAAKACSTHVTHPSGRCSGRWGPV